MRTKLDYQTRESSENACDTAINERDERYKEKLKQNAENRNTKAHNFIVGDHVLLKQKKRNKQPTAYEPAFYTIIRTDGSSIAAHRITDGWEVYRDASQFKIARVLIQDNTTQERTTGKKNQPQRIGEEIIINTEEWLKPAAVPKWNRTSNQSFQQL